MTYLEEYRQGINNGTYTVSERFKKNINCLADQALNSDKYTYNPSEPNYMIKWIETFCIQSKGDYYGKPVKLGLWQKAFIECIYSFKNKSDNLRRFSEVLLLVARKNGKSTLMACLGLYELIKGQGMTLACLSNSDAEAKMIWEEIDSMRMMLDKRSKYTGRNIFEIRYQASKNKIIRMSSNQRNLDGRNLNLAFFDEVHECMNGEIYEASTRSMGTNAEHLMIMCTTNGYVRDHFLDEKLTYAHAVIDGEIEDDTFLAWLYEQDTEDEIYNFRKSWKKSNPSLDYGVKTWVYLEDKMHKAQYSEKSRIAMLCKEFNIATLSGDSFLTLEEIEKAEQKTNNLSLIPQFAEERGKDWVYAVVGVDLSKTTDLTCCCFVYQLPEDNTIYCLSHFWIPKRKIESGDDDRSAGADYITWASRGYLTITDDAEISGAEVADWIYETTQKTKLRPLYVGHDRWQSKQLTDQLDYYGIPHEPVKQGYALSSAIYRMKDEIHDNNLNFDENKVMSWCLSNLKIAPDKDGNVKAVKTRGSEKIDGAITLIMGIEELRQHRKELEDANR